MLALVIGSICLALAFDFLNGMNDAANSIATVVSTRVLSPRVAVVWAAFFNFVAAFVFGVHVATTIGKGIVEPEVVTPLMILAVLVGAVAWTWACTHIGLPISVSHALVGGLIGAAVAKTGDTSCLVGAGILKVTLFIFVAPLIGLVLGMALIVAVFWVFRRTRPGRVDRWFRRLQLVSAALYSLGHGTNDAQKTMGIITGVLFSAGYLSTFQVPVWVILAAHAAIALGTLAGGWRIVHTMGTRITRLRPRGGFAAETAAATSILLSTALHVGVSTTHVITGAIAGVGSIQRVKAVRWSVATRIVWAWIFTIPASAAVAWLAYWLLYTGGLDLR